MLQIYCQASAITAVAVGCVVLYGWAFHIELFLSVLPGWVSMKANTALGLGLSGASFWLLLPLELSARRRRLGQLLALAVTLLGACTLIEYFFGLDLGIDQLLFREPPGSIATFAPGRMAPSSTTAFLTIGLSLMLLDWKTRRGRRPAQLLSLWAVLIGMLAMIGYIYHATALYRLFLSTQVAVHTAVTFFLLGTAILFARPQHGIAGDLTSEAAGSVMARRFLPAVFLIPIVLGWIGLHGEMAGFYETELDLALFASACVLAFAFLLWSNARDLNGEYEQRFRAEIALRDLNAELEERVADRTETLEQQAEVLTAQAALLDLAPDAIVVMDMENRVLFWNRGAEAVYGWSLPEAMGKNTFELLKTQFFEPSELVRAELLRRGHWEGDAVQFKRDGTRLIVASRSALQNDADGIPVRIFSINNDVTAHRQANESLREEEDRFRDMANNISQLAWMADETGSVFWYNQRWFDYSATTMEEMAGWGWQKIHHPDYVQGVAQKIRQCFQSGEVWEDTFPMRGKDGSYRWFLSRAVPIRDTGGRVLRWFGTNTDVTDRQQAESRLQSLAERLSLATAVAKIGVWEWDVSTNMGTWDDTMLDMYGFPITASITYEKWSSAVCAEDRLQVETTLQKVIEEKGRANVEFRILRGDGSQRNIAGACRAVLDENANVSRVIGVNIDVTDRKASEKALEENRQNQIRFKDEFLSHVSHEIRSPLFAIMQFTTIMLDGLAGEISDEQREYEQIVLQNAYQMKSMVDDLLDVTRLENGKLRVKAENLLVPDAVSDALNTLNGNASANGVTLSCKFPSGLPAAYADPIRLRQILIILVDNAIKFTPFGGSIKVHIQPLEKEPEFLCVEVSDTGCGIEPSKLEKIFQRLYQTLNDCRPGSGLGLGLYICRELVTLQGGRIWAESELEKGSTFSFTLPIFSLKKFMAALLKDGKWPTESAALVTVEISGRDSWPFREAKEEWAREVRGVVRRSTMADRDMLLPKMSHRGEGERFLVAAFADEAGASILCNRIRDQFDRYPHLIQASQTVAVSYTMMNPFVPDGSASTDDIATALVTNLEETIRSQNLDCGRLTAG